MLKLFNTLSRKIEEFRPIEKNKVKMYNCGPTVYDFAHVGNLRTFTLQDLLRRYLEFKGLDVFCIMNITDVDDKTIKRSLEQGVSLKDYTQKYFHEFLADIKALGIKAPEKFVFATENIHEMVTLVEKLLKNGLAYKSAGGSVYFDIKKFKKYGFLSKIKMSNLKKGTRVDSDEYGKANASDFVLWKAWQPSDGNVFWETEIGRGRPGWHLECSAMSMKYLGEHFDIHGGGIDLVFPHHENEIAQSEGVTGKKFVNHWVHFAHLIVDGKKMSKSLGNFYTLRGLSKFEPRAIRHEFLKAHYRDKLNFSLKSLEQSQKTIETFDELTRKLLDASGKENKKISVIVKKMEKEFEKQLDFDLDLPKMFAALHKFIRRINKLLNENNVGKKNAQEILGFLKKIDSVLALFRFEFDKELEPELLSLLTRREEARKHKDFRKADEIRALLLKKGVQLDDTFGGVRWKKIKKLCG